MILSYLLHAEPGSAGDDGPGSETGSWWGHTSGSDNEDADDYASQCEVASFCPAAGCLPDLTSLSLDIGCLGCQALRLGGLTTLTHLKVGGSAFHLQ